MSCVLIVSEKSTDLRELFPKNETMWTRNDVLYDDTRVSKIFPGASICGLQWKGKRPDLVWFYRPTKDVTAWVQKVLIPATDKHCQFSCCRPEDECCEYYGDAKGFLKFIKGWY